MENSQPDMEKYKIFDDNLVLFNSILEDIRQAKQSIWIEIFRFGKDAMGQKFRMALESKLKEGVEVKLLLDAWGTGEDISFFEPLISLGAEVRLYRKVKLSMSFLSKNHCRNHRKLIVIDSAIGYIGSSNITAYCLNWRELNLRTTDEKLLSIFHRSFKDSYRSYERYSFNKIGTKRDLHVDDWVFIQDLPGMYRQKIKSKYERLIEKAQKEVIIESPYFLPGHVLRRLLCEAAQRGVNVVIMSPYHSDVHVVDIVRRHYLGILHRAGVKLYFYTAGNLHSKGVMVDGKTFSISSANFDYRSFRYQYELALVGKEPELLPMLREHFDSTQKYCNSFDYQSWKNRSTIDRIIEFILLPFRYLF